MAETEISALGLCIHKRTVGVSIDKRISFWPNAILHAGDILVVSHRFLTGIELSCRRLQSQMHQLER
jgi:hypothetical protein